MDMFLCGVSLFWNYTELEHLVMLDCLLGWRVRELSGDRRPWRFWAIKAPLTTFRLAVGTLQESFPQAAGPCLHSLCAGVACGSNSEADALSVIAVLTCGKCQCHLCASHCPLT